MGTSIIRFVTGGVGSTTAALDLTAAPWQVLKDGTTCPPPPLKVQAADSLMSDGAPITASSYDNREINLSLQLDATTPGASATERQKLNRILNGGTATLMWQPDTTTPAVWFRCWRSPDYEANDDYGIGVHRFQVQVRAEPFAYGAVEALGTYTVANNPVAGTNPCHFDVTAVAGDVETPLWMSVQDSDFDASQFVVATRRRGTPSNNIWFFQAEAAPGYGPDTSIQANSATFSGAGSNYVRTTFSTTPGETGRITVWYPAFSFTASTEYRGTYRMYARIRKNTSGDVIKIRRDYGTTIATVSTSSTSPTVVDLGLVTLPSHSTGMNDGYGAEVPSTPKSFAVLAQRVSGSGTLDWDYFFFVPADTELAVITTADAGYRYVLDGPNRSVHMIEPTGSGLHSTDQNTPRYDGALPMLSPGSQTTRVFILNGLSPSYSPSLGSTAVFTCKYWPRYLGVRPVST